jgi:hypothetical protein
MATYRVWNAAAGTPDGLTWDTAFLSLGSAFETVNAPGHTYLVHNTHIHNYGASATTLNAKGTLGSPSVIACVNKDAADAPSEGAMELCAASFSINNTGMFSGMSFQTGNASTVNINLSLGVGDGDRQHFSNCKFYLDTTASNAKLLLCGKMRARTILANCGFWFGNWGQYAVVSTGAAVALRCAYITGANPVSATNGYLPAGLSTPYGTSNSGEMTYIGMDLTSFGTSLDFGVTTGPMVCTGCTLPVDWGGSIPELSTPQAYVLIEGCRQGASLVNRFKNAAGNGQQVSTVYRNNGLSSGSSYSWQVVTGTSCNRLNAYQLPDFLIWNTTVNAPVTVTVPLALDSASAMVDGNASLVVSAVGDVPFSSTAPGGSATNMLGDFLLPGTTTLDASSETWTGTGGWANEQKRQLTTTITPNAVGWLRCTVSITTPSFTVYVDKPVIS